MVDISREAKIIGKDFERFVQELNDAFEDLDLSSIMHVLKWAGNPAPPPRSYTYPKC